MADDFRPLFDRDYVGASEDTKGVPMAVDLVGTDFKQYFRRLIIGSVTNGTAVKLQTSLGATVTYKVAAGTVLDIQGRKIYKTGTTASDIIAEV